MKEEYKFEEVFEQLGDLFLAESNVYKFIERLFLSYNMGFHSLNESYNKFIREKIIEVLEYFKNEAKPTLSKFESIREQCNLIETWFSNIDSSDKDYKYFSHLYKDNPDLLRLINQTIKNLLQIKFY